MEVKRMSTVKEDIEYIHISTVTPYTVVYLIPYVTKQMYSTWYKTWYTKLLKLVTYKINVRHSKPKQ